MLSEAVRSGRVADERLGVLAKTILCIRQGCIATGPEVEIGGTTIQLAEGYPTQPAARQKPQARQAPPVARAEAKRGPKIEMNAAQAQVGKASASRQETKVEGPKPSPHPSQPEERPRENPRPKEEARPGEAGSQGPDLLSRLVDALTAGAKVDRRVAEEALAKILEYLSIYPSVGIVRLVEDVSRSGKFDKRLLRTALEVLHSAEVVEIKDVGVVNLRRQVGGGYIPL